MIDDVNSNGLNLVPFNRIVTINATTGALVASYDFTEDMSATYTPVGTVTPCNGTGTLAILVPRRLHLTGPTTFSMSNTTQSITFKVRSVGDLLNPPTITDNIGATPIYEGEETWSALDNHFVILTGTLDLTLFAGDEITVIWTELQ